MKGVRLLGPLLLLLVLVACAQSVMSPITTYTGGETEGSQTGSLVVGIYTYNGQLRAAISSSLDGYVTHEATCTQSASTLGCDFSDYGETGTYSGSYSASAWVGPFVLTSGSGTVSGTFAVFLQQP